MDRKMVDAIRTKPIKSIAVNSLCRHNTAKIVAVGISAQAHKLALAEPMYLMAKAYTT